MARLAGDVKSWPVAVNAIPKQQHSSISRLYDISSLLKSQRSGERKDENDQTNRNIRFKQYQVGGGDDRAVARLNHRVAAFNKGCSGRLA
jgi:hypothetical protein